MTALFNSWLEPLDSIFKERVYLMPLIAAFIALLSLFIAIRNFAKSRAPIFSIDWEYQDHYVTFFLKNNGATSAFRINCYETDSDETSKDRKRILVGENFYLGPNARRPLKTLPSNGKSFCSLFDSAFRWKLIELEYNHSKRFRRIKNKFKLKRHAILDVFGRKSSSWTGFKVPLFISLVFAFISLGVTENSYRKRKPSILQKTVYSVRFFPVTGKTKIRFIGQVDEAQNALFLKDIYSEKSRKKIISLTENFFDKTKSITSNSNDEFNVMEFSIKDLRPFIRLLIRICSAFTKAPKEMSPQEIFEFIEEKTFFFRIRKLESGGAAGYLPQGEFTVQLQGDMLVFVDNGDTRQFFLPNTLSEKNMINYFDKSEAFSVVIPGERWTFNPVELDKEKEELELQSHMFI